MNPYGEYFYDQVFLFKVHDTAGPEAEKRLLLQKKIDFPAVNQTLNGVDLKYAAKTEYRNKLNMIKLTYKHLKRNGLGDVKDRYKFEELPLVIRPTSKPNVTSKATTERSK